MTEPTITDYRKACASLLGTLFGHTLGVHRASPNVKDLVRAHMTLIVNTLAAGAQFHPGVTEELLTIMDTMLGGIDIHLEEINRTLDRVKTETDLREVANLGIQAGKRSVKRLRDRREKESGS